MTAHLGRPVFLNGCLPTVPFRVLVKAVSAAGFDALTLWPNVWRHAQRRDGLTLAQMRTLLDDHGLQLTDVDGCRDWLPPDEPGVELASPISRRIDRTEFFEVCAALGGTTVVAVPVSTRSLHLARETDAFGRLCDDAATAGLRVALEYIGWEIVHDLPTARSIIAAARRPAGLVVDIAHHVRGGSTLDDLDELTADEVHTVQLCDGPADPPADPPDEATFHRQLPGEGQFPIAEFVAALERLPVSCPVGIEVYQRRFEQVPPEQVTAEIFAATKAFTG